MDNRYEIAEQNGMSREFSDWFFDNKKAGCGNVWFMMMAAMWEGWQGRAAMLKGAEPVTTANKLPDDFDFDRFNDVVWLEAVASNPHMHSPTTSTIAMVALELNKRLSDGNSPEFPWGWVACSERMPDIGTEIFYFCQDDGLRDCGIVSSSNYSGRGDAQLYVHAEGYDLRFGVDITHWMPLPAAPQQEAKNV